MVYDSLFTKINWFGWQRQLLQVLVFALLFGIIMLFLRLLFGPGGPLREKEWDSEPEAVKRDDTKKKLDKQDT
jgi:hypothetical protein